MPLTESPTETRGTEPGVVMGTVGYMSPEQVRGQLADHRSDIFSLGAVLYEMLTGTRAFRGDTPVETMNAILKEDPPDPSQTIAELPPLLDRVVRHCLEKSAEERFQSARDVAFDLESLSANPSGVAAAIPHRKPLIARRFRAAAAGLALLSIAVASFIVARATGRPVPPSFHQLTFRRGYVSTARFAPDGQTIVFGAAWDGDPIRVFTSRSDAVESTALPLPEADVLSLSGMGEVAVCLQKRNVEGFATAGTLARVPLAGGAPRAILDDVQAADWDPAGSELAMVRRIGARHVLEFPPGKVLYETGGWVSFPRFSPDGGQIAFFDHPQYGDDRGAVAVIDRAGGKKTVLSDGWSSEQGLAWAPSGKEVWFSAASVGVDKVLYGVTLSGKRRVVLRSPGSVRIHDISGDGRALVSRETLRSGVLGRGVGQAAERDLSARDFSVAADVSNDGRTVLISEQGGGVGSSYAVYLREMDGSPPVKLGEGLSLALSPDKKWALALLLDPRPALVLLPTGPGQPRPLPRGAIESYGYQASFAPDGKSIVFDGSEPGQKPRLYLQSLDGGLPRPISPEGIQFGSLGHPMSPDGGFTAAIGPDGKPWLYPLKEGDPVPIPGADVGESAVAWSANGRFLYLFRRNTSPPVIDRLELGTRRRTLWKELAPADPAGLLGFWAVQLAPDGEAYAYSFWRLLSDLYLAEGLR
jgi:Tol biopolymer transport system component